MPDGILRTAKLHVERHVLQSMAQHGWWEPFGERTPFPLPQSYDEPAGERLSEGTCVQPFAGHARELFRPDRIIVVIVGSDFDDNLLSIKTQPAFHYLVPDKSGKLTMVREDYQVPRGTPLIRRSALAQYLYWSLKAQETIPGIFARLQASPERTYVGNTLAAISPQRVKEGAAVIDGFLGALPTAAGLPTKHIILVVDGLRESLYSTDRLNADEDSYFGRMRTLLIERAGAAGFEVLDMMPRFVARHGRDGSRFEYPWDNHWNEIGHEETALGVLQTDALAGFP